MTTKVEYKTVIYDSDSKDAVAFKKQHAKRQAFASLNIEIPQPGTYVIKTSERMQTVADGFSNVVQREYIFTVVVQDWSNPE